MPIPTRRSGESDSDSISRCMEDETMKEEFTDTDQRLAVCASQEEIEVGDIE